jgi:hypothetical protein
MKRFKQYLNEGRYPAWVKVVVGGIVVRLSNLQSQIESESDQQKRDVLLGRQNKLLGIISGLGIGVNSSDPKLLTKLRSIMKSGGK